MREPSKASAFAGAARWLEVVADPIRLNILRALSQVAEATASDLATWSQASSQTLRRHLEALVSLGVIREHAARSDGETPGRPAARFSLSSEVSESVRSVFDTQEGETEKPGNAVQAVAAPPSLATLASTNSIAAVGPTNGARAI